MSRRRPILICWQAALAIATLSVTLPAHAYIDPNAGGLLFQLLAPVFAAVVGGWIFLRQRLGALLRRWWSRLFGQRLQ